MQSNSQEFHTTLFFVSGSADRARADFFRISPLWSKSIRGKIDCNLYFNEKEFENKIKVFNGKIFTINEINDNLKLMTNPCLQR